MKYIMPFLENSIVIAWIAPIVTTLGGHGHRLNLFGIRNNDKERTKIQKDLIAFFSIAIKSFILPKNI